MTDHEMDEAVAKAIGYECVQMRGKADTWWRGNECLTVLPAYSTSDADAFAALDAVLAKHPQLEFGLRLNAHRHWHVCFWDMLTCVGNGVALTRPAAICKAILALEAV